MTDEQIMAKLSQMIRVGFVNARMPEKMRVKVTIPDTVGKPLITDFLPVLCPRACEDMQYDLPDIGDQVLVLFLAYGLEQGFVVGAMYGKQVPPVQSGDKWHRKFKDGTYLEYDREEHKLTANVQGDVEITATGNIRAELEGELSASAQGPASIKSASGINMDSPSMSIGGSGGTAADMQGDFRLRQGDVTAEGISLRNHTHTCPACGARTSPPVGGGSGESGGSESGDGEESGKETGGDGDTGSGNGGGDGNVIIVGGVPITYGFAPDSEQKAKLELLRNSAIIGGNEEANIVSCLPAIAQAMAEEAEKDKDIATAEGWLYLKAMFEKWLLLPPNKPITEIPPFWIKWAWLIQFKRIQLAYEQFTMQPPQTGLMAPRNIFNQSAKQTLGDILSREGYLKSYPETFEFINSPWEQWEDLHHTSMSVNGFSPLFGVDGLTIVLNRFSLRALANGWTRPVEKGWQICVEEIAVFAHDIFNFESSWISLDDELGYWSCVEKKLRVSILG